MFSLLLQDGDIVVDGNDLQLVADVEEVAQCVEVVLGTNKEEWFLNLDLGIDYTNVLEKSTNAQARNEIILGIAQEPRIETVDAVTILNDKGSRARSIKFEATSTDGEVIEREVTVNA